MYIYAVEDKTTRVINIRIPLLEIHINIASLCYMECLPQTVGPRRIQVRVVVNTFDLISPVFTFIIMLESASVFRFIYMYIFLTTAIYL